MWRFAKIRRLMNQGNSWLAMKFGPQTTNLMEIYKAAIQDVGFGSNGATALHFGSGRDKHGIGSLLHGQEVAVVSLDSDEQGLRANMGNMKVKSDGCRLPFVDEAFELVFSEYTFEHVNKPWDALREIDRVLKCGGAFIVLVPNRKHYYVWVTRLTPFWFHRMYLRMGGRKTTDIDHFPTVHKWGSLSDIRCCADTFAWELISVHSTPGPTGYTQWLPIHFLFIALEWILAAWPDQRLAYLAYFRKTGQNRHADVEST